MEKDSPPDRDILARRVPRYLVFGQLYVARTLGSNSKLKIAKDACSTPPEITRVSRVYMVKT